MRKWKLDEVCYHIEKGASDEVKRPSPISVYRSGALAIPIRPHTQTPENETG